MLFILLCAVCGAYGMALIALLYLNEQKCLKWREPGETVSQMARRVFATTQYPPAQEALEFVGMLSAVTTACDAPQTVFAFTTVDACKSPVVVIASPFSQIPVVVFVTPYLKELNTTLGELKAVIAHEIGHFKRRYTFFELLHYLCSIFLIRKMFLRCEIGADLYAARHANVADLMAYLEKALIYGVAGAEEARIRKRLLKLRQFTAKRPSNLTASIEGHSLAFLEESKRTEKQQRL